MKVLVLFLWLGLFAGGRCSGQGQNHSQSWIERLRTTPLAQMEAGLSEESFADWFEGRVKRSETGYEVIECREPNNSINQQRLLCVVAYTRPPRPGWHRRIQLDFVVGVLLPSATGITEVKPVPCRFLIGSDGPSNPQMKRPTYLFFKLSDFAKWWPAPATRPNSG